jgi:predicted CoA-binding protein
MKQKRQQPQSPKEQWARLYMDQSEESSQVIELLRNYGFRVITFPINGRMGPELKLGRHVYRGMEEIKKLIQA